MTQTGGETLPQIKSNIKTMKLTQRRELSCRCPFPDPWCCQKAVAAATTDQKDIALREAQSVIDTAARKGIIHKNAAARKKSRLNASVNAAIAADSAAK